MVGAKLRPDGLRQYPDGFRSAETLLGAVLADGVRRQRRPLYCALEARLADGHRHQHKKTM